MGGEVRQLLARHLKQVWGDTNACRYTHTYTHEHMYMVEVLKDSEWSVHHYSLIKQTLIYCCTFQSSICLLMNGANGWVRDTTFICSPKLSCVQMQCRNCMDFSIKHKSVCVAWSVNAKATCSITYHFSITCHLNHASGWLQSLVTFLHSFQEVPSTSTHKHTPAPPLCLSSLQSPALVDHTHPQAVERRSRSVSTYILQSHSILYIYTDLNWPA